MNAIDPRGTDVLVIVGGRRNDSNNVFGHVSIAVTGGGVYSFGTGTPLGSDTGAFLAQQAQFRDQHLYDIPTTSAQDQAALNYLNSQNDNIGYMDNCADRTYQSLRAAGVPVNLIGTNGYGATPSDINNLMQQLTNAGGATETILPQRSSIIPNYSSFNPGGPGFK